MNIGAIKLTSRARVAIGGAWRAGQDRLVGVASQRSSLFEKRGGKRRGAGRKPKGARAGSSHRARPELKGTGAISYRDVPSATC
jgi:hypothetical protein